MLLLLSFCIIQVFVRLGSLYTDLPSSSPGPLPTLISGVYRSDRGNNSIQVFRMEHSALQGHTSHWNLEVKYRVRENKGSAKRWVNIWSFYPDAKVELKRNAIELTISSPNEDHEFAVFGTPGREDKKRMQMGIFGGKPKQGKHWQTFVTLLDDTMMAFKHVCEREERKGRQLLTTLAGLFVANSDEDIKIDITALQDGWKIRGSHLVTIKSKDAWNSPENSTDFPYCVFDIAHVDETKQTFFCAIQASHLTDTAETELVEFFEQENEVHLNNQNFIPSPDEYSVIEGLVKADTFSVYELNKLAGAIRDVGENLVSLIWELCARVKRFNKANISFTGEENAYGGPYDMPVHWKQEQTEAFVSFVMLVFLVGCLTGTRFDQQHPLKVDETDGKFKVVPC